MKLRCCLNILLFISFSFSANAATYYKSVDKNGKVQYSQTKPLDTKVERIKLNIYPSGNQSSNKRPVQNEDNKNTEKTSDETPPIKTKKKLSKAQKKKGCKSARANLATLKSKGQIRQRNAKGEISYLSDKQKQARIKKTQELVNKNCK